MTAKLIAAGFVWVASAALILAQAKTGTISGTVNEGPRPQVGLQVVLTDAAGKVQGTTSTNDKGIFEFKDVAAGAYKVSSSKPSSGRKGSADAKVEAGKTATVTIALLLQ
jgi:hypothetical protein